MNVKLATEDHLSVDEIMTRDPISVASTDPIQKIVDAMYRADIRHVPVVRDGEFVGMVSDRDIRSHVLPLDEQVVHPEDARARLEVEVSEIIQDDVLSVNPDSLVGEVIDIMLDEKVGAVAVTDDLEGKLVGIVSYIDVLRVARDRV